MFTLPPQLEFGYGSHPLFKVRSTISFPLPETLSGITRLKGARGSGKSTFLRTLAGLQDPLSGKIQWHSEISDSILYFSTSHSQETQNHPNGLNPEDRIESLFKELSLHPTRLILIDEPFLEIDPSQYENLIQFLKKISSSQKKRIILAHTEPHSFESLCDSLLEIHDQELRLVPTLHSFLVLCR